MSGAADLRYSLRADVAIEDFGERALVLLCDALELREINGASRRILAQLDGVRTVADIAEKLAPAGGGPVEPLAIDWRAVAGSLR